MGGWYNSDVTRKSKSLSRLKSLAGWFEIKILMCFELSQMKKKLFAWHHQRIIPFLIIDIFLIKAFGTEFYEFLIGAQRCALARCRVNYRIFRHFYIDNANDAETTRVGGMRGQTKSLLIACAEIAPAPIFKSELVLFTDRNRNPIKHKINSTTCSRTTL